MIELIIGSIIVPFAVYLYIKYIRIQPKITEKTHWKYIHSRRSTSSDLKYKHIFYHQKYQIFTF